MNEEQKDTEQLQPKDTVQDTVAVDDKTDTQSAESSNSEMVPVDEAIHEAKPTPAKKSPKKIIIVLLVTILLAASVAITYFLTKKSTEKKSSTAQSTTNLAQSKATTASTIDSLPKTGHTWLENPQKVEPLPLFRDINSFIHTYDSSLTETDATYYKLGASPEGYIYAVKLPGFGGVGPGNEQLVVQAKQDKYSILTNHSPSFFTAPAEGKPKEYTGPELSASTSLDATTEIADIKTPINITYKNQKLVSYQSTNWDHYIDRGTFVSTTIEDEFKSSTVKKEADIPEGIMYEVINKDEVDYKVARFVLLLRSHFVVTLKLDGELSRADVEPITWTDGSKNTIDFASGAQGCGQGTNNEIAKLTVDKLKQIGKTAGGQKIYGFADINNTLLKKHYDEYAQFKNDSYVEADHKNLSLEQYAAKPALFLVEDGLERFLVFESTKTRFGGGCAKPVVYLYPTSPTLMNVRVGANVTLSDPQYSAEGWNNVLAMPNGTLGYNGKQYDSLFWEGYGYGEYPSIEEGMVVPRQDAEQTMRLNLSQLGLNTKETSDFMSFWTPKIPNSPYVRLTWFGTDTMDRLAPLSVSPSPTTRIRVFLDMEGRDTFVQLPPQRLSHQSRLGFTMVEWGGLARDGSVPLLR